MSWAKARQSSRRVWCESNESFFQGDRAWRKLLSSVFGPCVLCRRADSDFFRQLTSGRWLLGRAGWPHLGLWNGHTEVLWRPVRVEATYLILQAATRAVFNLHQQAKKFLWDGVRSLALFGASKPVPHASGVPYVSKRIQGDLFDVHFRTTKVQPGDTEPNCFCDTCSAIRATASTGVKQARAEKHCVRSMRQKTPSDTTNHMQHISHILRSQCRACFVRSSLSISLCVANDPITESVLVHPRRAPTAVA